MPNYLEYSESWRRLSNAIKRLNCKQLWFVWLLTIAWFEYRRGGLIFHCREWCVQIIFYVCFPSLAWHFVIVDFVYPGDKLIMFASLFSYTLQRVMGLIYFMTAAVNLMVADVFTISNFKFILFSCRNYAVKATVNMLLYNVPINFDYFEVCLWNRMIMGLTRHKLFAWIRLK